MPEKNVSMEGRKEEVQKLLDANQRPPHSKTEQIKIWTWIEGTLAKKDLSFFVCKCSFGQDGRTNPTGSENGGAQTEKRSCLGWHVGHEPSILGKQMNDERKKNDDDKTRKRKTRKVRSRLWHANRKITNIFHILKGRSFLLSKVRHQLMVSAKQVKHFYLNWIQTSHKTEEDGNRKQSDMGLIYFTQTTRYISSS